MEFNNATSPLYMQCHSDQYALIICVLFVIQVLNSVWYALEQVWIMNTVINT